MEYIGVEIGCKYTLTGPDGTIAVFNDSTDPNFVGHLSPETSGLDSADVREDTAERVEEDGLVQGSNYYGGRPVILQGTIIASSPTNRNQKVAKLLQAANAMRGDCTLSWQTTGGPAVRLLLRRQQPVRITEGYVKKFQIPLIAAFPYIEGAEKSVTGNPTASTSKKFPTTATNGLGTWTNLNNIKADDAAFANYEVPNGAGGSVYGGGFGFAIPTNAVISSVKMFADLEFDAKMNRSQNLNLYANPATYTGIFATSKALESASSELWTPEMVPTEGLAYKYPNSNNVALTPSVLNGANTALWFGIDNGGGSKVNVKLDYLAVEATYYTPSARNEGTANAYPVCRIKATAERTNPSLINLVTGQSLNFSGLTLYSGNELVVDFKNKTAYHIKPGFETINAYKYITFSNSTWWSFAPGDVLPRATNVGSDATFYWRDAWA